jgi:hypothetical protein
MSELTPALTLADAQALIKLLRPKDRAKFDVQGNIERRVGDPTRADGDVEVQI